ncbi:hypothetical protein Q0812_02005 [Brevundimonas sp. 2R-24]|uniref:Lipoprotein n=1 Tax=Peiella sedimenti TaxID=3061083 RepID=A0ABT8SI46_9CAUL|nr:hypothetical protein [Caulobacteraceae bacterium XZ-24]
MLRIAFSLLAGFGLAACQDQSSRTDTPAHMPQSPPEDSRPATPAVPADEAEGPAYVGVWAAYARWCEQASTRTDQTPIRITAERFEGYENTCAITSSEQTAADSWRLNLSCVAEGQSYEERLEAVVQDNALTLAYPDRPGAGATQLVRCGPAS